MKVQDLLEMVIVCAQEAKSLYDMNAEAECMARLDAVVNTVTVLRDFFTKAESIVIGELGDSPIPIGKISEAEPSSLWPSSSIYIY